jgi:hypothetical protein
MSDRPLSDDIRAYQIIWGAIIVGALLGVSVLWWLRSQSGTAPMAESSDLLFLVNAGASVVAIIAGFMLQRMIGARMATAASEKAAMNWVRTFGLASIAVMEGSALLAGVIAFLTGYALNLAFVVPFLAFAWLFFPSRTRIEGLLRR